MALNIGKAGQVMSRGAASASASPDGGGGRLLGIVGRVTVSIPADGPGEVLLPVRGGTEAFAAWSDEPIPRHRRVVVVDTLSARSVFVTPC
jgi:hypothetical protein